jgi:O-acetyl-ADP-ribose deacetylase (regulator of RNase III)
MSITYISAGNLLDSGADLLVVPVCCVPGVMGAGLARAFAERWPGLRDEHDRLCRGFYGPELLPSLSYIFKVPECDVMMFATKAHWKNPSRLEWIEFGLGFMQQSFSTAFRDGDVRLYRSIAMPALGCGLGGLPWPSVRPLIVGLAELFPSIDWKIYLPGAEKGGGSNPRS